MVRSKPFLALSLALVIGPCAENYFVVAEVSGAGKAGSRASPEKAGIQWVSIPGGSYMMGSGESSHSKPVHWVSVKAFQLAKTEVTNKQYRACVEAGACSAPSSYVGGDDQPVVNVDWGQSKKFSEWVGGRLPSEAEWEYAARSAGKDWKYPWGNEDPTCERAVISGCGGKSAPVCSKTAGNTKQGLCDMAGNVWEWTQDWYHDSYKGAPSDGGAWESPTGTDRGLRGGAWSPRCRGRMLCRAHHVVPASRFDFLGFRPAR